MIRAWLILVSVTVCVGLSLSTIHSYFFNTGLNLIIALVSIFFGFATSSIYDFSILKKSKDLYWNSLKKTEKIFIFFIILPISLIALRNFFISQGDIATANPNNLGDLPFHLHLMNYFLRGAVWPFENPIYSGEVLRYAYGVDFFDAIVVSIFKSLQIHEAGAYFLITMISLFIGIISLRRIGGVFLVAALFFSGGFVLNLDPSFSFGPASTLAWKNLFYSVFLTQRGFLYALPAGCYLISLWQKFLDDRVPFLSGHFFWVWATLPIFHLHSFYILSIWFFISSLSRLSILYSVFCSMKIRISASFALAIFLVYRSIPFGENILIVKSAIGLMKFWLHQGISDIIINWMCFIVVPIFVSIYWLRNKKFEELFVGILLSFIAFCIRVAPHNWDQIKVLIWIYILWIFWFFRISKTVQKYAVSLSLLFFWPGIIAFVSGLPGNTHSYRVQDLSDIKSVNQLLETVSVEDIIFSDSVTYQNPVLGSGQKLFLGYSGHVWSHGLDLDKRQRLIDNFWKNPTEGLGDLHDYNVKYILARDNKDALSSNQFEVLQNLKLDRVLKSGDWWLWRLPR